MRHNGCRGANTCAQRAVISVPITSWRKPAHTHCRAYSQHDGLRTARIPARATGELARGRKAAYGLMSSTGVPSMRSAPPSSSTSPSIASSLAADKPIGLGR
eukprot:scaffold142569_cov31-Tisochrysis_lutea.AAC.2